MILFEVIILAIIQGITEFLPISSSAHLLLPNIILGWQEQGLAFDVAVHLGSLAAVLIYFRDDILEMTKAWFGHIAGQGATEHSQLAWWLIGATIPAVLVGFFGKAYVEEYARSGVVIASTTIAFGLLLWLSSSMAKEQYELPQMGLKRAIIIGLFQVLALIPGTSRSGITITAGLFLGLSRESAAKFSFLLSIPVILGASLLLLLDLLQQTATVDWLMLSIGTALSFVSAYLCITLFLSFIKQIGFLPFVIYRLILGVILFSLVI